MGGIHGVEQDVKIVSQIRDLITTNDVRGVATIDALCFVVQASYARLTIDQQYIFEFILALFGNDIRNNICTFITFADDQCPPVLSALEALKGWQIPFGVYYPFNNSALYADNSANYQKTLSSFFWKMGMKSCGDFFHNLIFFQKKSLLLTSKVLTIKENLEKLIFELQKYIKIGLSNTHRLETEVNIFKSFKRQMHSNEKFEYEVDENRMEVVDTSAQGIYTINCLVCNFTCHKNCTCSKENKKENCYTMGSDGTCSVCPKKCHWTQHVQCPYFFKWYTQKVKKTYYEMKQKFDEACKNMISQEYVLRKMQKDIEQIKDTMQLIFAEITRDSNRLKEIALHPDPLSSVKYIEIMIEDEMRKKIRGFEKRIQTLEQCKKKAVIRETYQSFENQLSDIQASIKASSVETL